MQTKIVSSGVHHVTAITSDAQRNLNFYTQVLGLRLVKLTVNFDDPSSYHFYYGDASGNPGTILTFFAWPGGSPARHGKRSVSATTFAVPVGSLKWWQERLIRHDLNVSQEMRGEAKVLQFKDFDGMNLEMIESPYAGSQRVWEHSSVSQESAIAGFYSVTLTLDDADATSKVLTQHLGFERQGNVQDSQNSRLRFTRSSPLGGIVDIIAPSDAPCATTGAGGVHHVAFRAASDVDQARFQESVQEQGLNVSPVLDRSYFHSIYFREPGGVLFEIATDAPGFTVDEPYEALGSKLKLPSWMEAQRPIIEARVSPLTLPQVP